MLPLPSQQPARRSGASARPSHHRWSVWTQEAVSPTSPSMPTEDLADLVRKNDIALSKLQPETPGGPARYQDNRGTLYYEYDDDWVSTISPTVDRMSRASAFFRRSRMDGNHLAPEDAHRQGPRSPTSGGKATAGRRTSATKATARRSTMVSPWVPFDRTSQRFSYNPSTIAEGTEPGSDGPTRRSLTNLTEDSGSVMTGDDIIFLNNATSGLDHGFGEGASHGMGTHGRRPVDSSDISEPPSYHRMSSGYPRDEKNQNGQPPAVGAWPRPQAGPNARRSSWDDAATLPGDRDRQTPLPPPEKRPVEDAAEEESDVAAPIYGWRLVLMTFALSLAVFIVGVDINIVATAIPEITKDFGSVEDIGWYGSAFLLTTCAFQVPWGRMYTYLPAKWVFTAATIVFEIGSLLCAVSQDSIAFIVGRAVQGMGVAGMLNGALIIMSLVVPLPKRSLLGGIIGAMEGVAMITAPLIGGFLTDHTSWRWCFYINLPAGGVALAAIIIFLNPPPHKMDAEFDGKTFLQKAWAIFLRLDVMGTAVLIPCIVCVLLALQWGGIKYDWDSLGIIVLFILAAVLLGFLIYMQRIKGADAMVPGRILKQRSIIASFWFMLCTGSALVVMAYFLPLWFQAIRKDSPSDSGIHMLPMILGMVIAVIASGGLVSAIGYYAPFMIVGTCFMSVGAGLLTTLDTDTSAALRIVYPAIFGLGVGLAFQQPVIAAQTVLPPEDIPLGTTVIVFGQSLGASIVVSIANTVFANRVTENIKDILGGNVNFDSERILNGVTGGGDTTEETLKLIMDQGGSEDEITSAMNKAITQSYYVALAMAVLSIVGAAFVEWRSVKTAQPGNPGGMKKKDEESFDSPRGSGDDMTHVTDEVELQEPPRARAAGVPREGMETVTQKHPSWI